MKDNRFPPKTRVAEKIYRRDEICSASTGEVISEVPGHPDLLIVEWDGSKNLTKVAAKQLILESDFKKLSSELELEFKKAQLTIGEKLKQAAKLIDEAQQLSLDAAGCDLADFGACRELFSSLDRAGWQSSSMTNNC